MTPRQAHADRLIESRRRIDTNLLRLGIDPRTLPVPVPVRAVRDDREYALQLIQVDHLTHAQTAMRLGIETHEVERLIAPRAA